MSYSNPTSYCFTYLHDFGAATEALIFRGPNNKQGTIEEVEVIAYETLNAVTTEAAVNIGSTAAGTEYVSMGLGTLADGDEQRMTDTAADLVSSGLPADTDIHLTLKAPTGGTPAGKAYVQIMIQWF